MARTREDGDVLALKHLASVLPFLTPERRQLVFDFMEAQLMLSEQDRKDQANGSAAPDAARNTSP